MTRRLRYSVAATLDGFIADPDGGYDWIIMDESIDFAKIFEEFDTFVMGRKTWDVSAQTEFVQMFGTSDVIVFSRTLETSPRPGVKIVKTSPADTVRELKNRNTGKDIWLFGGGTLFRTLVDEGSRHGRCRDHARAAVEFVPASSGPRIPGYPHVRTLPKSSRPALVSIRHVNARELALDHLHPL